MPPRIDMQAPPAPPEGGSPALATTCCHLCHSGAAVALGPSSTLAMMAAIAAAKPPHGPALHVHTSTHPHAAASALTACVSLFFARRA